MNWQTPPKREWVQAVLVLAFILNGIFFPAIWGGKTLLNSAWDAPSVMPSGAYHPDPAPAHFAPTPDPGAPAWQTEPWLKIISDQYLHEHRLPLWNPYSAYGTPLAAAMQPQPFYPLTVLISLHPTAWTYNLFVLGRLFLAGLLTFFFARLFLGHAASLFAAITFMLTGYFILYLGMPHLSVEVLLPAVFLALELLLRRNSWPAVAATSGVIFLCVTGGMPESLFLVVSFGCLYFIYRLIFSAEFSKQRLQRVAKLGLALILGFALSAFLLLPFLEFMRNAHDAHQAINHGYITGLGIDSDWRSTITYLLPNIFGPALGGGWNGMRSYWGILPILFAAAAVMGLSSKSHSATSTLKSLTIFFFAFLVLMILKRLGNPLVNWIGRLPVAEMVFFVKYQEPLMAFCVAILAGIGFSLFLKARIGFGYFFAAALVVLVLLLELASWSWPRVLEHKHAVYIFDQTLIAGVGVLFVALLLFGISTRYPRASWPPWAFVGMLALELCFNFIYPNFYRNNELPSAESYNPYAGAPYVDFLRQRNTERYRVFGRDGVLFPDWAGVFKLMDVRDLDGMYYRRYIYFVRNFFLRSDDETRLQGDLADRFTGTGDGYTYDFATDRERRFLALSSIRYVISTNAVGIDTSATIDRKSTGTSTFKNIYDDEVRIYEFTAILPRATLYYSAEILPDEDVLNRLKGPSFNPEQRVVLSAETLPEADSAILKSFAATAPTPYAGAHIVSYDSESVKIETQSDAPAILMLNDANYPGWRVFVNGRPASILQADYLFRAVIVPAGRATVEFDYEPASFRIGALISLAGLVALVVPLFGRRAWRHESSTAEGHEPARDIGSTAIKEPAAYSLSPTQAPVYDSFGTSRERNSIMSRLDDLDVVIRSRKGKIFASIPQLSLLAKGATVDAALAALDAKKQELAAELEEVGELDMLQIGNQVDPMRRGVTMTAPGDLGRFAIKTSIVVFVVAVAFLISGMLVAAKVKDLVNDIKSVKIGGAQFWGRVEQQLDRMATSDLPEAKKQKLLADIHAIAVKWRPFVAEVQSVLSGPPNQAPPTTTPTNR